MMNGLTDTSNLSEYYGEGEIKAETNTNTIEEAFIALTGGVEEKELRAWREEKDAT